MILLMLVLVNELIDTLWNVNVREDVLIFTPNLN